MLIIIGTIFVTVCVLVGYAMGGGHLEVLWQPLEFLIIFGAGFGALFIGTPKLTLKQIAVSIKPMLKGPRNGKKEYTELLTMLYALFRLAKMKGDLALESHVESPKESPIISPYKNFCSNHEALEFTCDYLRLLTFGTVAPHEIETIMDSEIDAHHHHLLKASGAITTLADGLPALGIVAAVLGVIHTMGSITEPPEVLGHLIGAALVGTFSGVLFSYGYFGPYAKAMEAAFESETEYLTCIKNGILAHMQGYAPQISVEFARKTLPEQVRPTFLELEKEISNTS